MRDILLAGGVALLLGTATAHAHSLIAANSDVAIARSALRVTPDQDWNKLSQRPGRNAETWTLDGEQLNDLTFYGGIEDGRTLFREVDRRNRPLPRFSNTMLPTDLPALLENSYRIARSVSVFTIDSQVPATVAGGPGIRFTYSFVGPDEIARKGEASAAVVGGRLYLIAFEAPAIHFFESGVGAYRRIVASARMEASGRR